MMGVEEGVERERLVCGGCGGGMQAFFGRWSTGCTDCLLVDGSS